MQKERIIRFSTILAALLFAMSALSFFKAGEIIFGFILLIISGLNIIVLMFLKDRKRTTDIVLNFMNAVAAGITTYDYIQRETDYIHYVWILTTLMFISLTLYLIFKKDRRI
ncbi:MAG: hypothetical protein AB8G11_20200 [Saprospiraceae bacterium]